MGRINNYVSAYLGFVDLVSWVNQNHKIWYRAYDYRMQMLFGDFFNEITQLETCEHTVKSSSQAVQLHHANHTRVASFLRA